MPPVSSDSINPGSVGMYVVSRNLPSVKEICESLKGLIVAIQDLQYEGECGIVVVDNDSFFQQKLS